jgi:predicted ATPase/transcriptional regulator with XRE-family HTH domain
MSESLGATRSGTTAFGAALRSMRLAAGLSQGALAERAGLSEKAVGALERGDRTTPRPATIVLLADAVGASPAERDRLLAAARAEQRPTGSGRPTDTGAAPLAQHGLLVPPTPLLGRQQDIAAVSQLVSPSGGAARLVTLIGPGGVGKTRIALAVALELVDAFANDVWFVDLSPLRDYRLVAASVAGALDVRESGGRSAHELLIDALRERQVLLVLDNFEHVLDAAPFVADLLSRCPRLSVLVTSRTPLRLRAERRFMVEPLSVPRADGPHTLETITTSPAVQLFVDRAQAFVPDFELTPSNGEALGAICRRLDGVPLAIELAAARVPLLSPDALLRRLERPFPELSAGTRDLPSRQQTLYNTLAWSYELLGPAEQALFRRLAVFAGGWTLEAAEAVCAGTDLPSEVVLDRLDQLVESSLVHVLDAGRDELRFGLLEIVREYAADQLTQSGEDRTVRGRHRDWCLNVAERTPAEMFDPDHIQALAQEQANLRAALAGSIAAGDAEQALRLAVGVYPLWYAHGHYGEGRAWFRDVVNLPGAAQPVPLRIRALAWAGHLAYCQADYPAALALIEASHAEARMHDDEQGVAVAVHYLADVVRAQGNLAAAQALYAEALARNRHLGNTYGEALALLNLAGLAAEQDDPDRAVALVKECLPLLRGVGARWDIGRVLIAPALAATPATEVETVRRWLAESVALERQMGDRRGLSWSLLALARYAALDGDVAQAGRLCAEALQLAQQAGDRLVLARGLEGVAALVSRDTPGLAVRLAGAADALREALGAHVLPAESARLTRWQAAARQALGEAPYAKAWALGRSQRLDLAVADALGAATTVDAHRPAAAPA